MTIYNLDTNYFDNACQTPVLTCGIEAFNKYTNICVGRGNYQKAEKGLEKVSQARNNVKKFFDLDEDWCVVFGYNTTQLINHFVLSFQYHYEYSVIKGNARFGHNSTFLQDKNLLIDDSDPQILVKTLYSNVDGQKIKTEEPEAKIRIYDIAQGVFSHTDFKEDSIYIFSGHKAYSTHLGIAIAPRKLLESYSPVFVGGGMVDSVNEYTFNYSNYVEQKWEAGLQNSGSIISLGEVFNKHLINHTKEVYKSSIIEFSKQIEEIVLNKGFSLAKMNQNETTSVISIYKDLDSIEFSLKLSKYLSENGFATRSGVLCADSYFMEKDLPPVCRISLGLNNDQESVNKLIKIINDF